MRPRVDLVRANLSGLPSTLMVTAEIDPLRTEGQALAQAPRKAGVDVAARDYYADVAHEFFGMAAVVAKAKDAPQYTAAHVKPASEARKRSGPLAPTLSPSPAMTPAAQTLSPRRRCREVLRSRRATEP